MSDKYESQRKELLYKPTNGYHILPDAEKPALEAYSQRYIAFLNAAKTEREAVKEAIRQAEAKGFVPFTPGMDLAPGTKVYQAVHRKAINLAVIGQKSLSEGTRIAAAHIDNPRLDLKPNPLYEEDGMAFFQTHYYGGIKKYQWTTVPMSIHGVIVKRDGEVVDVCVGEKDEDPVFIVTDLLIHLAAEQLEKKAAKVIEGEALDIIVGNKPLVIGKDAEDGKNEKKKGKKDKKEAAKDAVKAGILQILKENYDMEEEDFISAELEVVPAGKAREAGFDRSMILSYGQDDRVCAYTSLQAMLDLPKQTGRTVCCILVDKEEIGSVGATGMQSKFFENAVAEVMNLCGEYSELALRRCLAHSCMLSSDVSSAYDPSYAASFDKKNVAYLGGGMVFNKFTGARGKSGSNDANAEYIAHIRKIFAQEKINFQTAELGKVDLGGGGTIAYILALYGMNVIDSGVPVLSMHAPWEATSKADLYEAYRGYMAFLRGMELQNI